MVVDVSGTAWLRTDFEWEPAPRATAKTGSDAVKGSCSVLFRPPARRDSDGRPTDLARLVRVASLPDYRLAPLTLHVIAEMLAGDGTRQKAAKDFPVNRRPHLN